VCRCLALGILGSLSTIVLIRGDGWETEKGYGDIGGAFFSDTPGKLNAAEGDISLGRKYP